VVPVADAGGTAVRGGTDKKVEKGKKGMRNFRFSIFDWKDPLTSFAGGIQTQRAQRGLRPQPKKNLNTEGTEKTESTEENLANKTRNESIVVQRKTEDTEVGTIDY